MRIVVLEHPRVFSETHFNDIANTPLWSCMMGGYAAAALAEAGHAVHFMDGCGRDLDFDETRREILHHSPELLCVNAVYFWEHTGLLFDFFTGLRTLGFGGHLNLFGFFPTLAYPAILSAVEAVDTIALGECESTLVSLAACLERGASWQTVPGLAFRAGAAVRRSVRAVPTPDLDSLPFPLREVSPGDTVCILAARGCYNHCSFCPVPPFYPQGPLWRGRSPENVFQEIEQLVQKGFQDFYFVDPNFIGPGRCGKERILKLADLLRPLGVTFGMETRAGDLDGEIPAALASAGLCSLLLGIESGSESILKTFHKGTGIPTAENAVRLCRDAGIDPEIGFIMFMPDAMLEDLEQNLAFLQRNHLLNRLDKTANLLCHHQIVLMGTSAYGAFESQGRLERSGVLGFEGRVSYKDPRVRWIRQLMVPACLHVLRKMGPPASPVHWRNPENALKKEVNACLVDLFERLLREARSFYLPPPDMIIDEIEIELDRKMGLTPNVKSLYGEK